MLDSDYLSDLRHQTGVLIVGISTEEHLSRDEPDPVRNSLQISTSNDLTQSSQSVVAIYHN